MLKKYLKYSAAALLLLFFIDRFAVSGTSDLVSWGFLFFAAVFLVHAFFRDRSPSSMGKVVSVLLVPLSILTNLLLVALLVLFAFNYPPTIPVEPRIKIVQPSPDQAAGYAELFTLLEEADRSCYALPDGFSRQENSYDHAFAGMALLLNDKCGAERNRLLDFVTARVTAKPFVEMAGQPALAMADPMPKFLNLVDLYRIELIDVARLVDEGRSGEAFDKYTLLWKGAVNRLDSRDGLVNSMGSIAVTGFLTDFFGAGDLELGQAQAVELLGIMAGLPARLDTSLAGGLVVECAGIKGFMVEDLQRSGPQILSGEENILSRTLAVRALRWPFFDINAQLDFIDTVFADQIDAVYLPREKKQELVERMNRKLQEISDHPFSLVNPVGRLLNAIAMPSFSSYDEKMETVKSKVLALGWLLENLVGKDPGALPVHSLTGEDFNFERRDGYLKISGGKFVFRVKEINSVETVMK